MNRITTVIRRSTLAVVLASAAFTAIGCTSVKEHRVDVGTGNVDTVNRKQFFVKSIFRGSNDRVKYVQSQPEYAAQQPVMMNTNGYAPQPQPQSYAPQYAPQQAPQYAPAPQMQQNFVPPQAQYPAMQQPNAAYGAPMQGNAGFGR